MGVRESRASSEGISGILEYFGMRLSLFPFGLGLSFCYTYSTQRLVFNDVEGIFQVVQYLGTALSCIVMFFLSRRAGENLSTKRGALLVLPVLAGAVAMMLVVPSPLSNSNVVVLALGAMSGMFIGWLYLVWGSFYKQLDVKPAIWCVLGSLVLSAVLKLFIAFLHSDVIGAFACAAFPLLSMGCWWIANKERPPSKLKVERFSAKTLYTLKNMGFGVMLFAFAIGLFMSMGLQVFSLPIEFRIVAHVVTVAVGVSALFVAYRWKEDFEFSNLWFIVLLMAATGLVVAGFGEGTMGSLSIAIFTAAQMFVIVFYYLALADVAHNSSYTSDTVYGFGWSLYALCMGLGFLPIHVVTVELNQLALSLAILYLLLIALFFFMRVHQSRELRLFADLNPTLTGDRLTLLTEQIDRLAVKHGLSDREIEVILLYAQGRNRAFISQELFISENTVRDHIKNVYQKMRIHNKQELIDIIQGI